MSLPANHIGFLSICQFGTKLAGLLRYRIGFQNGLVIDLETVPIVSKLGTETHLRYCVKQHLHAMMNYIEVLDEHAYKPDGIRAFQSYWKDLNRFHLIDEEVDVNKVKTALEATKFPAIRSCSLSPDCIPSISLNYNYIDNIVTHPTPKTTLVKLMIFANCTKGVDESPLWVIVPLLYMGWLDTPDEVIDSFRIFFAMIDGVQSMVSVKTATVYIVSLFSSLFVHCGFTIEDYERMQREIVEEGVKKGVLQWTSGLGMDTRPPR